MDITRPKDTVFGIYDSLHLLPTRGMREDTDKKIVTMSNGPLWTGAGESNRAG